MNSALNSSWFFALSRRHVNNGAHAMTSICCAASDAPSFTACMTIVFCIFVDGLLASNVRQRFVRRRSSVYCCRTMSTLASGLLIIRGSIHSVSCWDRQAHACNSLNDAPWTFSTLVISRQWEHPSGLGTFFTKKKQTKKQTNQGLDIGLLQNRHCSKSLFYR